VTFPDTKHVKAGKLVATSPSAIEAWDETTSFGCQRRWFFESVQGIRTESTQSQALGTALHARIESYLEPEKLFLDPDRGAKTDADRLFLAVKPLVDEIKAEGIVSIENAMKLDVAGVTVNGRIDVVTKTGILDWKTTSDFRRYAKTPGQLQKSTQMLLYAKWLDEQKELSKMPMKQLSAYTLEHVYVQTKGKPITERVRAKINKEMLDVGMDRIISLVEEMKVAAGEPDVTKLKPDLTKCNRCPHLSYCPKENKTMASLLNRFKNADSTPASDTAPEAKPTAPEVFSVLPPDAPASSPELAAKPVPGFEAPAVQEKRPRGRPPGAKNKAVFSEVPPALSETPAVTTSPKVTVEYNQVTIAWGCTVPTEQFANQRLDVTLSAKFTGDVDEAIADVSKRVRKALVAELESVALSLEGKKLNPGGK
jgi:hypothetical protein